MQSQTQSADSHAQLRTLYHSLLEHEDRYHQFKQLLAMYPTGDSGIEQSEAAEVRAQLNAAIREWLGGSFDGLSAMQVLLWREIIIEERFNVALAPWKESNWY